MNRNWSVRSCAAIALPFCLSLWGLAAPVSAKTIVVTTLDDTADPPFDADGPCGTGTLNDLPGADGLISLREAIIAANNTPGADTITFSVSGGTIVVNFDDLDADSDPDQLPGSAGGRPALRATSMAMMSRISHWKARHSLLFLPPLVSASSPVTTPSRAYGCNISRSGSWCELGIFRPGNPRNCRAHHGEEQYRDRLLVSRHLRAHRRHPGLGPGPYHDHPESGDAKRLPRHPRPGQPVCRRLRHPDHPHRITDNEVRGNGQVGINMLSLGDHNVLSHATLAQNTVSDNTFFGINVHGGLWWGRREHPRGRHHGQYGDRQWVYRHPRDRRSG